MLRGIKTCMVVGGFVLCWSAENRAADAIVQDFGGWKITIQPGESFVEHRVVPISYASQSKEPKTDIIIQPGPPGPEPVPPPATVPAPPVPSPPADGQLPGPKTADDLPIITPGQAKVPASAVKVVPQGQPAKKK